MDRVLQLQSVFMTMLLEVFYAKYVQKLVGFAALTASMLLLQ